MMTLGLGSSKVNLLILMPLSDSNKSHEDVAIGVTPIVYLHITVRQIHQILYHVVCQGRNTTAVLPLLLFATNLLDHRVLAVGCQKMPHLALMIAELHDFKLKPFDKAANQGLNRRASDIHCISQSRNQEWSIIAFYKRFTCYT